MKKNLFSLGRSDIPVHNPVMSRMFAAVDPVSFISRKPQLSESMICSISNRVKYHASQLYLLDDDAFIAHSASLSEAQSMFVILYAQEIEDCLLMMIEKKSVDVDYRYSRK